VAAKANLPQNSHVPNTNVCLHSVTAAFHSKTRAEENEEENDRKSHGEESKASSRLDSNCAGKIHQEPDKEGISHILSINTGRCAISGKCFSSNNLVDKVVDGHGTIQIGIVPRSVVTKRVKEGIDDPRDEDSVVGEKHESTCYTTQPNTSQARMESSKDTNISSLKELSETNLENCEGDPNKEQSHEVRDKEGASSIGHA